jgi:hypothetical protein
MSAIASAKRLLVGVAALLLALPAHPAVAGSTDSHGAGARREAALTLLQEARASADAGTLVAIVREVAALDGIEATDLPAEVTVGTSPEVSALPTALATPLGELAAAVGRARTAAEGAVRDPLALAHIQERVTRALLMDTRASDGSFTTDRRTLERLGVLQDHAERVVDRAVDRRAIYSAALELGLALDVAVPQLQAGAQTQRSLSEQTVDGCDIVDLVPELCVAGTGNNLLIEDAALVIDLGGDDTHAHSAGAAVPADPYRPTLGNGLPVSVTVDVQGDDVYSTEIPTPSGATAAQGAGVWGGIGMLIDAGGDDSYAALASGTKATPGIDPTSDHPSPFHPNAYGQGFGQAGGFGLLSDEGGDDSYRLVDSSLSTESVGDLGHGDRVIAAGGGAGLTGAGALVDRSGNDSYETIAKAPEPRVDDGTLFLVDAGAHSYGAATIGVGFFADGSGNDRIRVAAATPPVAPDETRPTAATPAGGQGAPGIPDNSVGSWGAGLGTVGGVGVALTGDGSTTWSFEASAHAPSAYSVEVHAMGQGLIGGFGGLGDLGGDDVYRGVATTELSRSVEVDDACVCHGAFARAAESTGGGKAITRVTGMGFGWFEASAVLSDDEGDDTYDATATASAEAHATDRRTGLPPEHAGDEEEEEPEIGAEASAVSPQAFVLGQGVAASDGLGVFIDRAGEDRYLSETSSDVQASAVSDMDEGRRVAIGKAGNSISVVQGATLKGGFIGEPPYAEFLDLGGRDVYSSISTASASADPPDDVFAPAPESQVLAWAGSGVSMFRDIDGGLADTFLTAPASPACMGTRGVDTWQDCGLYLGIGVNR